MRCSDHPHASRRLLRLPGVLTVLALCWACPATGAANTTVIGPVYPIAEADLLHLIRQRLRLAQASGQFERLQREAAARIRQTIETPPANDRLTRATRARTHYVDPSLTVPQAISGADGRLLVAPGTRVNPLDTVTLSRPLLFIDARDADQLQRAQTLRKQHQGRIKLILTGGAYLPLMRAWKTPVYFDQQGRLATQLAIRHVPALVTQEGSRLRIDELP